MSRAMQLARNSVVQSVREIVAAELAPIREPQHATHYRLVEQAYQGLEESLQMWERAVMESDL